MNSLSSSCTAISARASSRLSEGDRKISSVAGVMTAETGTLRWMAPEVARHEKYRKSADVYSFAMMLFELVTHEVPFADRLPLQAAVASSLYGWRPTLPDFTPPHLAMLIQRCWRATPASTAWSCAPRSCARSPASPEWYWKRLSIVASTSRLGFATHVARTAFVVPSARRVAAARKRFATTEFCDEVTFAPCANGTAVVRPTTGFGSPEAVALVASDAASAALVLEIARFLAGAAWLGKNGRFENAEGSMAKMKAGDDDNDTSNDELIARAIEEALENTYIALVAVGYAWMRCDAHLTSLSHRWWMQ